VTRTGAVDFPLAVSNMYRGQATGQISLSGNRLGEELSDQQFSQLDKSKTLQTWKTESSYNMIGQLPPAYVLPKTCPGHCHTHVKAKVQCVLYMYHMPSSFDFIQLNAYRQSYFSQSYSGNGQPNLNLGNSKSGTLLIVEMKISSRAHFVAILAFGSRTRHPHDSVIGNALDTRASFTLRV
jgi:hypothetical protein